MIFMRIRKRVATYLSMFAIVFTLTVPYTVSAANDKTTLQVDTVKTMTINTTKTLNITSNGVVSCKTSNKNVISVSGKQLKAKGTGIAKITVTSKKKGCKTATKSFSIKVLPAQGKITSIKMQQNNISVTVKKLKGVTGYQFKYSTNSDLSKATVKNCKSNTFSFKANTKKTYYVTVRGYKKSGNTTLYGKWSKTSTINASENKAHTHNYKSSITQEATCSSNGVRTYKCSCGDSYTESIAATGHDWVDEGTDTWMNWMAAKQEDTGYLSNVVDVTSTYTCRTCGYFLGVDEELFEERYWTHMEESLDCPGAYTCVSVTEVHHLLTCSKCGAYKRGDFAFYVYPTWPNGNFNLPPNDVQLNEEQIQELGLVPSSN